ncbi:hypothetical protein CNMCM5793_002066 [Aspergillus hiratsukae]|uniref:Uncharacterized protein n=1 Tax=Aspergillus hiratsukae TaxID=1194566 RepID=A0A8H6UQH3_9EURO|nr:hypothetical protein CNMCM5793_002066 [Aspergillus hiratsukae]KAF7163393.1 hypothetical protein CNMCM6106_000343 [Aspergillus hiratsukae]
MMACLKTKKRDEYVDGLFNTWPLVARVEDPYLDLASLARFGIKCHNLLQESSFDEAPNVPKFFRKMPHEKLQEYKVDTDNKDTMRDLRVEKKLWVSKEQDLCDELHPLGLAATMCTVLRLAFDTHKRETSDGQKVTLMQTTGWKRANFTDGIFHRAFYDDVFHSKHWRPVDAWQSGKPKDQPHVMFTTAHKYEGNDNSLLRGEVLAIMAVMMIRLESGSFDQHNIIPVGFPELSNKELA